jgi:hypothetical protein
MSAWRARAAASTPDRSASQREVPLGSAPVLHLAKALQEDATEPPAAPRLSLTQLSRAATSLHRPRCWLRAGQRPGRIYERLSAATIRRWRRTGSRISGGIECALAGRIDNKTGQEDDGKHGRWRTASRGSRGPRLRLLRRRMAEPQFHVLAARALPRLRRARSCA